MADPKMASADDHEDSEVVPADLPFSQPTRNACMSKDDFCCHESLLIDLTVTELMRPQAKPRADISKADKPTQHTTVYGRDGLAAYTDDPAKFPQSRVVYYNDDFVVINDLYPKSVVHMLILPRDRRKSVVHPTDAFDDPEFLAICREEEKKVRALAASELRRKLGQYSAADCARMEAMELDDPPDEEAMPPGRDWDKEIMAGIHANPSMNHLHIHVLSRDLHSEKMKKYNHYQSFTTDFFVGMDEFPLREDDHRRSYKHFQDELVCWRCGRGFGRKFAELKRHLEEEFEGWMRE